MAHKPSLFSYDTFVHAVAGATGSVIAMATFYPLDTVRCRLQLSSDTIKAKGTMEEMENIVSKEGLLTLYQGMTPVLQSLCASNFIYFYTFHGLKNTFGGSSSATKDLLIGTVAGVINVLITSPLWVVNTRLKSAQTNLPFNNLSSGLAHIAKTEGASGLWAGVLPSLLLVSNPAIQFMTYEAVKRKLVNNNLKEISSIVYFMVGAVAKTVATFATYPLQLIQTRLRHGGRTTTTSEKTTVKMFYSILRNHGFVGLYRGLEAKLLQTVMTAALMFAAYEKIARFVISLLMRGNSKLRK